MQLPWVHASEALPEASKALSEPNGLVCAGIDINPGRLLEAYRKGIFPWYSEGQPVLWWSPDPRMVLTLEHFRMQRSLRKRRRQLIGERSWTMRIDADFAAVMHACAAPRAGQQGTWITAPMIEAYTSLHHMGYAHSVELWHQDRQMAGLYGVSIGRMFFGESMFSRVSDGSKLSLAALVECLLRHDFRMIDCQQQTGHLARMGAGPVPRSDYLAQIAQLCDLPAPAWSEIRIDWS